MSLVRPTLRLLGALVATVLLTSLLSGGVAVGAAPAAPAASTAAAALATSAATSAAAGPRAGAPQVGQCSRMTYRLAHRRSYTKAPVSCAGRHEARVIAVGRLPRRLGYRMPESRLYRAVARTCQPALDATLGRSAKVRDRSAYTFYWFLPTRRQIARGARWFRCDVVLQGARRPKPLAANLALPGGALPDALARCLTGRAAGTACADRHRWRATGAFSVASKRYPGDRRLDRLAQQRCPRLTSSRYFRWTHRDPTRWRFGHVVVCYTQTRR